MLITKSKSNNNSKPSIFKPNYALEIWKGKLNPYSPFEIFCDFNKDKNGRKHPLTHSKG